MKKSRLYSLSVLVIGVLISVSLLPLHIYADTIERNQVTLNTSLISKGSVSSGTYNYLYNYEFLLDDKYIGWITVSVVNTYYNTNQGNTTQLTWIKALYVNSDSVNTTYMFISPYNGDGVLTSSSFTITNSNVIKKTDDIEELINKKLFNIPIESYSINMYSLYHDYPIWEYMGLYSYDYPIYELNANDVIVEFPSAPNNSSLSDYTVVLGVSTSYGSSAISRNLSVDNGNITDIEIVNRFYLGNSTLSTAQYFQFIKFRITGFTGQVVNKLKTLTTNKYIMVYFGYTTNEYISTDFALRWGLSNQLLNDIHSIAVGTNQSSSSSSALDNTTSQFTSDSNDLITIEDSFNNSMNNALQNVSPTFNMGQSFLNSANWVSTQFNRIVNNTPFASLITFGLTLGLGLLIIGKVRK